MTRLTMLMGNPAALAAVALTSVALAACGKATSTSSAQVGNAAPGADFCTAAQTFSIEVASASSPVTDQTTLPALKAGIQVAAAGGDGLDSSAGTDISADTHKLRAALDSANQQVQAANDVSSAQSALSGLASSDYKAARGRVDAYVQSHCGFSINASSSGTSAGTGGSSSGTATSSSTS